jgi:hypothetical protein
LTNPFKVTKQFKKQLLMHDKANIAEKQGRKPDVFWSVNDASYTKTKNSDHAYPSV